MQQHAACTAAAASVKITPRGFRQPRSERSS